ncbi:hypothetical protein B0H14DRAFT_3628726 [Mycena olivaceomarginata]|nr:hypothetical protein B0H14DRAFT_3628726 [Mycena olivaceomarginata]
MFGIWLRRLPPPLDSFATTSDARALSAMTHGRQLNQATLGYRILMTMYAWRRGAANRFNHELGEDMHKAMVTLRHAGPGVTRVHGRLDAIIDAGTMDGETMDGETAMTATLWSGNDVILSYRKTKSLFKLPPLDFPSTARVTTTTAGRALSLRASQVWRSLEERPLTVRRKGSPNTSTINFETVPSTVDMPASISDPPAPQHAAHARAHLSTITERLSWDGASGSGRMPGSAAWDGRFRLYEPEERYSGGSERHGDDTERDSATLWLAGLARPSEAFSAIDLRAVPLSRAPRHPHLPVSAPRRSRQQQQSRLGVATHAKQIVQSRGTAFSTALDIARKAERRKSAHWFTPQHTGAGALMPQFTGSSGLVAQYTGDTLAPATHRGEAAYTTAHRLGAGASVHGLERDVNPAAHGREHPFSDHEVPAAVTCGVFPAWIWEDGNEEQVPSPRVLVGGREGEEDDDVFVAEPAEVDVEPLWVEEEESEQPESTIQTLDDSAGEFVTPPSPNSAQDAPIPVEEAAPATPIVDSRPQDEVRLEESVPLLNLDAAIPLEEAAAAPTPLAVDSRPQVEPDWPRTRSASVDTHDTHSSFDDAPSSPDSAHPGLDLDAHLRSRAFLSHLHLHSTEESSRAGDSSRPSSVSSVDGGTDAEPELKPDAGDNDDDTQILLLPNTLHTHAFRAHLSTITERLVVGRCEREHTWECGLGQAVRAL